MLALMQAMETASVIKLGKFHALFILNIQRPPRAIDLIKDSKFHFDVTLPKVLLLAECPAPAMPNIGRPPARQICSWDKSGSPRRHTCKPGEKATTSPKY